MIPNSLRLTAALALAACLFPAAAAQPSHEHEPSTHALQLDHGKKWSTDAPLRSGMTAIRDAVAADHHAIHANRETLAQYQALAQKVEAQVGHIVANCKLSPEADANLHVLLSEIVTGVERMKGSDRAQARTGAVQIVGALQTYPQYFDHPGWHGLE